MWQNIPKFGDDRPSDLWDGEKRKKETPAP